MKTLSIIIPAYNEKDTILKILKKVEDVDFNPVRKEIILVDDCSTDGTREILESLKYKYKVYFHEKNYGKGKSMRTGLEKAAGDWIIFQDADLEYNPEDIKNILNKMIEEKAKVVYGSRFLHEKLKRLRLIGKEKTPLPSHYIGNKLLSFITGLLYGQKVTDMETGYKMMEREVAQSLNLESERFSIEPEITAKILRNNHKIIEMPIEYTPRGLKEGKKISWRDGAAAIWALVKYRFKKR